MTSAAAAKSKPELWSGQRIEKAEKGSIVVGKHHVRLRNKFTPKENVLLSNSNDNQTFTFWIVAAQQNKEDEQYLKIDNDWWSTNGTGYDNEGTKTSFQFDRATALRVRDAFGIPMHERQKLDDGLRYTFRFPPKVSTDTTQPIEVVLRVENVGKTTVGFMIGGRQRGARNNRFIYAISKNGKPLKIKDAPDFGGIGFYEELKPGAHVDVKCADLREWVDFDVPGYYTIEAKFEGELAKDGKMPNTAAERANLWDITALGQGSILVQ
jgi:hypothetical protein